MGPGMGWRERRSEGSLNRGGGLVMKTGGGLVRWMC